MIIATRYNTSCIHNILFSKKLQSHISSDITIPRSGAFPKMISQDFTGAMQTAQHLEIMNMLFKKDNAILSNFHNECTKSIHTHPRTAKKKHIRLQVYRWM